MEKKTATTAKPASIGGTHKEEVRLRVIEQAMRMFQAHGIKSVTMDSIADALKMSKRTLYELFADKAALLLAGLRLQDERKERCMQERLAETDNVLEIILGEFADSMRMFSGINPDFCINIPLPWPISRSVAESTRRPPWRFCNAAWRRDFSAPT